MLVVNQPNGITMSGTGDKDRKDAGAARKARLAAELRANLKRRKAKMKGRGASADKGSMRPEKEDSG